MTENAQKAFADWKEKHHWVPDFEPVDGFFYHGEPMVTFYRKDDEMPWSVQYAGNGCYFKTREEAEEYIEKLTHRNRQRKYRSEWEKKNKDKLKTYRQNYLRRKYLPEYLKEHPEFADKYPEYVKQYCPELFEKKTNEEVNPNE